MVGLSLAILSASVPIADQLPDLSINGTYIYLCRSYTVAIIHSTSIISYQPTVLMVHSYIAYI